MWLPVFYLVLFVVFVVLVAVHSGLRAFKPDKLLSGALDSRLVWR